MNIENLFNNNNTHSTPAGAEFVYNAAARGQQDILTNTDKLDEYIKHGITPVVGDNLDKYLADTQSWLTKWGNGIAQTLVSELLIGIPKAFSDLAGAAEQMGIAGINKIADAVGSSLHISDGDYTNPVSNFLEEQQEAFRKFAPVYVDPDVNILNGGLKDAGWWASNMPSIMSSLTLLLPGMAVTKGAGAIAKALNIGAKTRGVLAATTGAAKRVEQGKRLSKFQRFANSDELAKATGLFLENGTTAAISRTVENYQEAHQTYDDMYVKANEYFKDDKKFNEFIQRNEDKLKENKIDINNKDEVAKFVAKNSADETFKLDYLNTVFDVLQLYALKNVWKGVRNAPDTSRKIVQANKTAASRIGKTAEEVAKIEAAISKTDKIKDKAKNIFFGSKKVMAAELSEGVEEAVNYIAQQEGMTFGNTLLTGEGTYSGFWERVTNGFDGRLDSYLRSSQLWDSAFWGWLGGITFQGLGSFANRAYNTLEQKAADKETDEVNKEKKPWWYLEQLPEVKRRIEDIRQRNETFKTYQAKLNDINKGIDVFADKKLQAEGQLDTEELKEAARNRAFKEYVTEVTMSALNSGNYDLLKAYFQDENLRKGLIESGVFKGEGKTDAEIDAESRKFVDDAVRTMEETANKYDEELIALHNFMIGKKFKGDVPAEILSIIANDNIYNKIAINQTNENITATDNEITKERARIENNPDGQKLDSAIDYEGNIKLAIYAQQLAEFRKQRKEISKQEDSVSKRISLSNIDNMIDSIERRISHPELIYTTAISLMDMKTNTDGSVSYTPNDEYYEFYKNIVIGNPDIPTGGKIQFQKIDTELLKLNADAITALDDNQRHMYKVLESDINNVFENLSSVSPKLNELYQAKALYEIQKDHFSSYISRDADNVNRRIGEITNTLHGARRDAISRAGKIISELYKKHGNVIRDIIRTTYTGDKAGYNQAVSNIPVADQKLITDALTILDLTKSYNQNLAVSLENKFDLMDLAESAKQAKAEQNGVDDYSTDSETISDQQEQNLNNSTQQQQNVENNAPIASEGQVTQQNPAQPVQSQTSAPTTNTTTNQTSTPQPAQNRIKAKVSVTVDAANGKYENRDLELTREGDHYVVENNDLATYNDDALYEKGNTVLTRPFEVESKPIVVDAGNEHMYVLDKKGKLVNTDTEEYRQRKAQQAAQQQIAKQTQTQQSQQAPNVSTNLSTGEVNQPNLKVGDTVTYTAGGQQHTGTITKIDETNNTANVETKYQENGHNKTYGNTVYLKDLTKVNIPAASPGVDNSGVINTDEDNTSGLDKGIHNGVNDKEIQEEEAFQSISSVIFKNLRDNKNNLPQDNIDVYIEKLIDNRINELVKEGKDRAILESQKPGIIKFANSVVNRIKKQQAKTLQSTTDELIVQTSLGVKDNNGFRIDYVQAINDFLDLYCDELGVPTINGKKYIDIESVFRFINKTTNDSFSARFLYYGVTEYLNTDEAREKFIRTDDLNANKEEGLANINKTAKQRRIEKINANGVQRINLDPASVLITGITDEENIEEQMDEAFQSINNGDEIFHTQIGNHIVFTTSDGKILGTNVLPSVNTYTGVYTMRVTNFIYDLDKDNNGKTTSKLKDRIYKWFTDNSDSCKELRSLLYSIVYDKLPAEQRQVLIDKLYETYEFKQAIQDGLIIDDANANLDKLRVATVNHLGKLLNFRNEDNRFDNESLQASLSLWFDKVYENYKSAIYLSQNPTTRIQVSNVNDGTIIRIADKPTKDTSLPVKNAIAGGINTNIHKIAITDANRVTRVSGGHSITTGFFNGNTHVAIPNRNGQYEFVKAFGSSINDDFIGDDAKAIIKAVKTKFIDLYNALKNNRTDENYNALKNFILDVFDKDNSTPLFYGIVGFTNNNILILRHKKDGKEYKIAIHPRKPTTPVTVTRPEYEKVQVGDRYYNQKEVELTDDSILATFDEMFNALTFNMNAKLLNSDNVSSDSRVKGIVSKSNNKFTITVGDQSWEYNSFNEFVLTNNLVSINTKPNEKGNSNFERNSKFQTVGYNIIKEDTSSPVEEEQQTQPAVPIPQNNPKVQQAINILNGTINVEHKGLALFSLFNNDSKVLNKLKEYNLLPENIIFDENFNKQKEHETDNAAVDTSTGQVRVGTKWLNLFENNRSYAMRVLIHEQLHLKLNSRGNKKYIKNIEGIFDEFIDSINEKGIKRFLQYAKDREIKLAHPDNVEVWLNQIQQFAYTQYGEDRTRRVEEFLVDSLMNGNLVLYLNSVEAEVDGKKGYKNLFRQILEVLADIFGWGKVEKGSLREKEIYSLRKILPKDTTENIEANKKDNNEVKTETPIDNADTQLSTDEQVTEEPVTDAQVEDEEIDVSDINDSDLELYIEDEEDTSLSEQLEDDKYSSTSELAINPAEDATSNTGEFSSISDDIRYSSTDELTIGTSSSVLDMRSQLPIQLRSNFDSATASAAIMTSCG